MSWGEVSMDIFGITTFVIIIIMFIIAFEMSTDTDYEDIPILINVLKNEDKVLFPIGTLMLGYQIYKSNQWGLSQETNNYVVIFWYIMNIFIILAYKFGGNKIENDKFLFALCINIVFTPVLTLVLLAIMIF